MKMKEEWPWSDELDAVAVVPDSHIVWGLKACTLWKTLTTRCMRPSALS